MSQLVPSNVLLRDYPENEAARRWQQTFVGRSGIRLRVRLSVVLQPANWIAEAPPFASCLDYSHEADTIRAAARAAWPSRAAFSPTRAADDPSVAGAGAGDCAHAALAPTSLTRRFTRRSIGTAAAVVAATTPVRAGGKRLRDASAAGGAGAVAAPAGARAAPLAAAPSSASRTLDDIESLHKSALMLELDGACPAASRGRRRRSNT